MARYTFERQDNAGKRSKMEYTPSGQRQRSNGIRQLKTSLPNRALVSAPFPGSSSVMRERIGH